MADNKIILKKSSVPGKQPLPAELEVGEIAVNLADQTIYTKDGNDTVIPVGGGSTEGTLAYKAETDTYTAPPALDGQVQDIGQEVFLPLHNGTGANIDASVLTAIMVTTEDGLIADGTLALANGLTDSSVYGIATTDALVDDQFKITTYGLVRDVDTSAYAPGTELFISTVTPGALTDQRPADHIGVVGSVLSQDVLGSIFVNTIRNVNINTAPVPFNYDEIIYSADEVTTAAGTFFSAAYGESGTAPATVITIADVDGNDGLVAGDQDLIGPQQVVSGNVSAGNFSSSLSVTVDSNSGNEILYVELYLADADGNAIDSGSGLDNGSLGVPPMVLLSSQAYNLTSGVTSNVTLSGRVASSVDVAAGQRFRHRILAQKIGNAANKDFTIGVGPEGLSFLAIPQVVHLTDLIDVESNAPNDGDVLTYEADGIWRPVPSSSGGAGELTDLTDVELDSLVVNQGLKFDGALWVNEFTNANEVAYNPVSSNLLATDVQEAIDNLNIKIDEIDAGITVQSAEVNTGRQFATDTWLQLLSPVLTNATGSDQSYLNAGVWVDVQTVNPSNFELRILMDGVVLIESGPVQFTEDAYIEFDNLAFLNPLAGGEVFTLEIKSDTPGTDIRVDANVNKSFITISTQNLSAEEPISEAPFDSHTYGRKEGKWHTVPELIITSSEGEAQNKFPVQGDLFLNDSTNKLNYAAATNTRKMLHFDNSVYGTLVNAPAVTSGEFGFLIYFQATIEPNLQIIVDYDPVEDTWTKHSRISISADTGLIVFRFAGVSYTYNDPVDPTEIMSVAAVRHGDSVTFYRSGVAENVIGMTEFGGVSKLLTIGNSVSNGNKLRNGRILALYFIDYETNFDVSLPLKSGNTDSEESAPAGITLNYTDVTTDDWEDYNFDPATNTYTPVGDGEVLTIADGIEAQEVTFRELLTVDNGLGDLIDVESTAPIVNDVLTYEADGVWRPAQPVVLNASSIKVNSNPIDQPDNPTPGDQYFDLYYNKPLWWSGSAWVDSLGNEIS